MSKEAEFLDFEQPIMAVASRIRELESYLAEGRTDLPEKDLPGEISRLYVKQAKLLRMVYRQLTPYQKVLVARHAQRPHARDYIDTLITDFTALAGDRCYGEDGAIIGGLGRYNGQAVAVIGTEKGRNTQDRMHANFGMPRPDGYRKAIRIMELAHRFKLPLLTFVDTPGAYPGVEAEARGQGEAIARCLETQLALNIPHIATIIGEGGSGGALALSVANKVYMLEHAIYSVISPEGCAAILYGEANKQTIPSAAQNMKLTAQDLEDFGIIDALIKEPVGGAHRDAELTFQRVREQLDIGLAELQTHTRNYVSHRREKFLAMTRLK